MSFEKYPSRVVDDYWVDVENPSPHHGWTANSGKWLLFIPMAKLDTVWQIIAGETLQGRLGIAAKSATAKKNDPAKSSSLKLICVYTYDASDEADVFRVRQRLRELGFEKKIPYKTDKATQQGQYSARNKERVSIYYA